MSDRRPIGVFDSGLGGLTVLREVVSQLPGEQCLYVADEREAPYGTKTVEALRARTEQVANFLLAHDAKAIVVACNTASLTALAHLRSIFTVPFIGIVPAVKLAATLTHTGKVGVLVTSATAHSESLAQLINSYAHGTQMIMHECPELVTLVEQGMLIGPLVEDSVRLEVGPLLTQGADILVLGCTHLPFLTEVIGRVCGPHVQLIDPAAAVARQLRRVLEEHDLLNSGKKQPPAYFTTGDVEEFRLRLGQLMGEPNANIQAIDV